MANQKSLILSFTTVSLEDNNLVLVKLNTDAEVDPEKAENFISEVLELVDRKPFYLIIDSRDIFINIDNDSREIFATHETYNSLCIAKALLVNNMPSSIVLKFYKKFYSHKNPIEIFNDLDKAKEWLFSHS